MGATVISQYLHRPNTTELGKGNTHEYYLLVASEYNLSTIFPPTVEVNVKDANSGNVYPLKASSGEEFRINQMGPIYRDFNMGAGDEVAFTAIQRGEQTSIYFTITTYNRVVLISSKKGVEIVNIDRLEPYKTGDRKYEITLGAKGNASIVKIEFKESKKKRDDSPNNTDFYTVTVDNIALSNKTYYLTLGADATLDLLPKATFNTVEIDDDDIVPTDNSTDCGKYNPNDGRNHIIIDIPDESQGQSKISDLLLLIKKYKNEILNTFTNDNKGSINTATFAFLKLFKQFNEHNLTARQIEEFFKQEDLYPKSGSGSGIGPLFNIVKALQANDVCGIRIYETQNISSTPQSKTDTTSLQTIYFGSPGTGKSFKVKNSVLTGISDDYIFRTTFHPDTDYASFVGCYKPTTRSNKTETHTIIGFEALVEKLKEYLERSYVDPKTQKSYKNVNKACVLFGFDYYDSIISMLNEDNDEHTIKSLISEAYGKDNTTYDTPLRAGMTAKETMLENIEQSSRITYDFAPQTFTNAYVKAWQNPTKSVYLVIEEINRGNCAQIFGDLFQLLDRDDNGVSEYPIKADADLAKYLVDKLGDDHEGIADGKIKLPSNLSIIATMNTSDQSLFPMDSAFKRRWEWKYVPTSVTGDKKKKLQVESKAETVLLNREQEKKVLRLGMYEYDWSVFLEKINKCITDATHSDDKQLGFWFVKTPKDSNLISIETFVSKVIFYLWTDVFKDFGAKATNPFAFKTAEGGMVVCPFSSFFDPYTGDINLGQIHGFMYNLGIVPDLEPEVQAAIDQRNEEEGNLEA